MESGRRLYASAGYATTGAHGKAAAAQGEGHLCQDGAPAQTAAAAAIPSYIADAAESARSRASRLSLPAGAQLQGVRESEPGAQGER